MSYIYAAGVSMLPLSTMFRLDFGTVPTMWYFCFSIFTTLYRTIYTIKSAYLNLDIHDLQIAPWLWYYIFIGCKWCYHFCILFGNLGWLKTGHMTFYKMWYTMDVTNYSNTHAICKFIFRNIRVIKKKNLKIFQIFNNFQKYSKIS